MEFSILKNDFLKGLSKVQSLVNRKTAFPITLNVLLTAGNDGVVISATDMESAFVGSYPASVAAPGTVTVPGRKLFEIVKDFPDESVTLRETDGGWVKIAGEKLDYRLMAMSADEFPALPDVDRTGLFSLPGDLCLDILEKADLPSPGTGEDKRPHLVHLLGFFMEKVEEEGKPPLLRLVATDGHRLARVDFEPGEPGALSSLGLEKGAILPKRAAADMARISEGGGNVELGIRGGYFIFSRENETLIGRLLDGEYPDYRVVIPKDVEASITVERTSFQALLKRVSIFTSENFKAVSFKLDASSLTLSIKNPEIGEFVEEFPVSYDGEPFETAFNPRYFIEAINVMQSIKIKVLLEKGKRACLVSGDEDPGYLMVIMPMRA